METRTYFEQVTTDLGILLGQLEESKETLGKFIGQYFEQKDALIKENEEKLERQNLIYAYNLISKAINQCKFRDPNCFLQV
jgi:hypothetical protein